MPVIRFNPVGVGVLLVATRCATAQIAANWLAPENGRWFEDNRWSTSPTAPNNGTPPGATYDVSINATGAPYAVTLDQSATVSSLALDSLDARLDLTDGGTLTVLNGIRNNSHILLDGKTISGTRIEGTGSISATNNQSFLNRLSNVSLGVPLTFQGMTLLDNLHFLPGGRLATRMDAQSRLTCRGSTSFTGHGEVSMHFGDLFITGATSSATGDLNVSSGITVTLGPLTSGIDGAGIGRAEYQNFGTLRVDRPGSMVSVRGVDFLNFGTIDIANGTLLLGGRIALSQLGTINIAPSAELVFDGIIMGGLNVLEANAATGNRYMGRNATLLGGTMRTRDGAKFISDGAGLQNTNLDGVVEGSVHAEGTLAFALGSRVEGSLSSLTGATLSGLGQVAEVALFDSGTQQRITIGSGMTVSGNAIVSTFGDYPAMINNGRLSGSGPGRQVGAISQTGRLTNNGTIEVNAGGVLTLLRGVDNNGTIIVDRATLVSMGNYSLAQLDAISFTQGSLIIGGSLSAVGQRVVSTSNRRLTLGGTVFGGTFAADPGSVVGVSGSPQFHNVVLEGPLVSSPTATVHLNVHGPLQLNQGAEVTLPNGGIYLHGASTAVAGEGTIAVRDINTNTYAIFGSSFSIDSGITIKPSNQGLCNIRGDWVNNGTLLIDNPGATMRLFGNWENRGTIRADSGSLELMGTFSTAGLGMIHAGSTAFVRLAGTVDNVGSTLDLSSSGKPWSLSNVRVTGGRVINSATSPAVIAPVNSSLETRLSNLTLSADFNPVRGSLVLDNVLLDDSTLRTEGSSPRIQLLSNNEITGTGTLILAGTNPRLLRPTSTSPLVIGSGVRVFVDSTIGAFAPTVIDGQLTIREASATVVTTGTITNNASLRVDNSSTLRIPASFRLINNASFAGAGFLDAITISNGSIDPEGPLALLRFMQAVTLEDASRLVFDLGSGVRAIGYDAIDFGLPIDVRGGLEVRLKQMFTPGFGDRFDLLDAPAIGGSFSSLALPALPSGLQWDTSSLYLDGSISVVPEATQLLATLGAAGLTLRRRRARYIRHGS